MNNYSTAIAVPVVHLAINKNRIKRYNAVKFQPIYYLNDNQEFQLEIYNPTTDIVKAVIWLNGKQLSGGSLVLKPAERVFLDRYLDSPQKFVFETYEVGNSASDKKATEFNGQVKVEFFKQIEEPKLLLDSSPYLGWPNTASGGYVHNTTTDNITYGNTNAFYMDSNFNNTGTSTATSFTTTSTDGFIDMNQLDSNILGKPRSAKPKSNKTETGMIGKGDVSEQVFKNVHYEFDYFRFHAVEYKILPISTQPATTNTLNVVQYCTNCGSKLKKSFKFCASCGTKI